MALKKKIHFWFGHVKNRSENDSLTRVHEMQMPFLRPRGRPKIAWHDCVGQYPTDAGILENLTANRDEWRAVINRLNSSKERRRKR